MVKIFTVPISAFYFKRGFWRLGFNVLFSCLVFRSSLSPFFYFPFAVIQILSIITNSPSGNLHGGAGYTRLGQTGVILGGLARKRYANGAVI